MADGIKISVKFKEIERYFKNAKKQLLSVKGVKAGYFEGKRYPDSKSSEGIEIARNALIQEKGDPIHNIPPRPFLSNTVDNYKEEWVSEFKKFVKDGLSVKDAVNRVGFLMENNISDQIDATLTPPNAPSTIRKKGSSHPLIDKGTLKNSISHEVLK